MCVLIGGLCGKDAPAARAQDSEDLAGDCRRLGEILLGHFQLPFCA